MKRSLAAATGLLITMPVVATVPAYAADTPARPAPPRVVAKDLNNPRQLNYAADGKTLIVAEAGRGGEDCAELPPPGAEEPGDNGPPEAGPPPCLGPTGSITHVATPEAATPTVRRVIEGLPSVASPNGAFAVGTNGADEVQGEAGLHVIAQSPGVAEEPTFEDSNQGVYLAFDAADVPPPGDDEGGIPGIITLPGGDVALLGADLLEAERRLNPDTAQVESNPYAILFVDEDPENPEDGYALVADAAANVVWKVAPKHEATEDEGGPIELEVTVFAAYPTTEEEPGEQGEPEYVPTSLAQDADGSIFVGGLGSEVAGAAEVVQYDATGKELRRFGGFTGITGVAVDDENIYVSQIFGSTPPAPPGPGGPESEAPPAPTTAPGSVVKTSRHTTDAERLEVDVPFPGGMVTDHMGGVYVSAYSTSPAEGVTDAFGPDSLDLEGGQVWQVKFDDSPSTTPGGPDEGPVSTNGKFVPVGEEYYDIEFTSDACGQKVTVTAGDVRAVEERVTLFPGDLVKRELRGQATVDIKRADGVTLDEVDVSGEAFFIESKPTEDGVVKVVASLEGASIVVPFDEAGEAELAANELPPIVLWLGGNITFSDTLQLGDSPDSMPTTIETDIINNTAVGILDVCALLDAESSATPTAVPTATVSPTATPSPTASPTASLTPTTTASPSPTMSPTPSASPTSTPAA